MNYLKRKLAAEYAEYREKPMKLPAAPEALIKKLKKRYCVAPKCKKSFRCLPTSPQEYCSNECESLSSSKSSLYIKGL